MKLILAITAIAFSLTGFAFERQSITLSETNSVTFNQQVKAEYVSQKMVEVSRKSNALPFTQPLYIVLDTPGGSVSDGNNFIDFVKSLNRPVHTIVIFAASMGYQITQELGKRYITPSGMLMSHRGAIGGLSGQVPGEANSRLEMIGKVLDGMNERAAKRVGMTKQAYAAAIMNELWIGGDEAVAKGHADAVASVKCDASLSGSYTEQVATIFGSIDVEFSKCPLISTPIGFKFGGKSIAGNSRGAVEVMKVISKKTIGLEF